MPLLPALTTSLQHVVDGGVATESTGQFGHFIFRKQRPGRTVPTTSLLVRRLLLPPRQHRGVLHLEIAVVAVARAGAGISSRRSLSPTTNAKISPTALPTGSTIAL